MNIKHIREFYTNYGYFQAQVDGNLNDGFIEFMEKTYDLFCSMGMGYRVRLEQLLDNVWLSDGVLDDDVDLVDVVEQVEEIVRYG